jgi:peptide/nickel transport system permease protein
MLPTTLGILLLTFVLFHVVRGSPAQVVLGKNATAEALAAFDARYGYDKPLFCGQWTSSRALGDGAAARTVSNAVWRLPLAYALPPGTYRISGVTTGAIAPVCTVRLADRESGASRDLFPDVRSRGGRWQLVLTVPAACRATDVAGTGTLPHDLRLRRRTAHFLDSQLVHYLGGLLRGELGESSEYGRPVAQVLRTGVGPSLALTLPILIGGTLLALMLAVLCALWRGRLVDRSVLAVSTVLMSVNYVIWVLAGQYLLAFRLRLFPIWGFEGWFYLALPVLIGIASGLGRDVRFFRTVILDEIGKPYVRTATAKGLSPARVMTRHVLRNSLIPIVTYVSLSIPFLFTGSLLLESFFGIPGLGNVSLNAIHSSDMAVVRAVVVVGALLYQGVNLLADLSYAWLDPRVRLG